MAERAEIILSAVDRTRAAFANTQRGLDRLQASTAGLALRFGAIGAAFSAAFTGASFKGAIDAGDELSKLGQKTGIAVERLSELRFAGKLADVDVQSLARGLRTLSTNMAEAASGGRDQAATFAAIGVSVKNAAGGLRSADDVLGDIADRFASYEDGAEKSALASKIFGDRVGSQLIPFLNQGRQGIADLSKEARELGVVFSADLARQSEEFNDNLTRIGAAAEGAKIAILNGLLPTLNATLEAFVKNTRAAGLFKGALLTIGQGLSQRLGLDEIGELETKSKSISAEIERVTNVLVGLSNTLERDPGNEAAQRRFDNLRAKLVQLQGEAAKTSDALKAAANELDPARPASDAGQATSRAPAPVVGSGAASRADALLRQQLANRLKSLEDVLSQERDAFSFHERYLQQVFDAGRVSLEQFYSERTAAAQRALDDQLKILDQQIAAQREFAAKASDPKDQERAQGEITEILARQAKLRADFSRDAVLQQAEQTESVKRLRDSYDDLRATIEQLSGNNIGADQIRNAQQVEQARRLISQAGGDTAQADRLAGLLQEQAALADIRQKVADATDDAAVAEERYLIAADAGGAGLAEQEAAIYAIRQKSLKQLQDLADKTAALAAQSDNPELARAAEQIRLQFERAAASVDPLVQRINAAAESLGDGIANSFGRALVEGGKLTDLIADIERQLLQAGTKLLITDPFSKALENAFKAAGKSAGGSGGGFDLFGSIGTFFSSLFHTGGIVGEGGASRAVSPLAFAGATRYHSGGLAGLAPDEVPAILRRREEVLTTSDPRHRDNGGGRPVNLTINVPQGTSRASAMQIGARAMSELQRAQRNT